MYCSFLSRLYLGIPIPCDFRLLLLPAEKAENAPAYKEAERATASKPRQEVAIAVAVAASTMENDPYFLLQYECSGLLPSAHWRKSTLSHPILQAEEFNKVDGKEGHTHSVLSIVGPGQPRLKQSRWMRRLALPCAFRHAAHCGRAVTHQSHPPPSTWSLGSWISSIQVPERPPVLSPTAWPGTILRK